MAKDRIRMPTSHAGITQYFDDYKSKIEIKPEHVIAICVVIIIIELLLKIL
jgi:preprotein translocase subunit Sec61beta